MSDLRIDRNAKTLRELTLDKLRGAIVQGYFRPGARLVERTLCDELGVSRTVVREVLRHLETEGLVEIVARQGPIVARLDPEQVGEIYELRGLLEANAARACAEQSTPELVGQLREIRAVIEEAFEKQDLPRVLEYTERFYEAMFEGAQKHVSGRRQNAECPHQPAARADHCHAGAWRRFQSRDEHVARRNRTT